MSRKVFPDTTTFTLRTRSGHHVATVHPMTGGFEEMATALGVHALMHAKLRNEAIGVFFADADEPVLNAYPQGYTEVYR